jgi:hypothetical protein
MARIHTVDLSEVIGQLPDIRPFDLSAMKLHGQSALFLCALGFESRCLTMPRTLAESKWTTSRCIYFEFATNRDDNEANRAELLSYLSTLSNRVEPMEADGEAFAASLRKAIRAVVDSSAPLLPLVVFDMSVTSNRILMRAMKVLLEFDIQLTLLYAEAAIYHPTLQEYKDAKAKVEARQNVWLDRGVSDVETSQEYPGYHVDQLPDCVMVIPGFNRDRVRAVIHKIDPTLTRPAEQKLLWLVGIPHLSENHWRIEMMRELHELTPEVQQFQVSTFEYKETLRTLETLYQERVNDFRFTITPMGSKLQALGCSLFCNLHPDVRAMFSVPERYNAVNFSEGCRAMWGIEFKSLKESREQLDAVGSLRITD